MIEMERSNEQRLITLVHQ